METCTHVFQISGIKIREEKRVLIQGIQQLGGKYIGGSVYQHACTHLIIPQVLSSEKFLAACAAGKWVVTPDYVLDSVKNGSWLAEEIYEVAISTGSSAAFYPVKQWREKVASGRLKGAFQGWRVLLMVQGSTRRAMFKRLLKAGRAEVYHCPPPSYASITHVMAKPVTESSKSHSAPCYPVSHIVQHLFGTESLLFGGQSNHVDMNFNITEEQEAHPADVKENFSTLEAELKTYIKQVGQPRLCFLEYLGYHDPYRPLAQATKMDFSNVGCMIECGLFTEALDSIRSGVYPGLLPPAPHLISLLEYAQQGNATSVFMRNFQQVLDKLLITNPPWMAPKSVKQYFTQVLQCPRCKKGLWSFLETAIRYSMSSEETCHALPGPGLPTLLHFHCYILTLILKIFQGELHSVTAGEFVQLQGAPPASASGSLLYRTFWTVWERSTLLSSAVKQLMQLLIQAAMTEYAERDEKQKLHLADTLLDFLSVLVEFWCQQHFKLNQTLVDKGLKDLSEYLAVISQDLSPNILVELVIRVRSTRLKLMVADAIFRNLCCRNGCTMGDEPLSLKKMVLFYLPALGSLALSPSGTRLRTEPSSHSCTSQGTDCRPQNSLENETCSEKENIPRGLNRVNAVGETLLHRACKRNQVETVLQILVLPGIDINVKDHAGWTPLHEACNHGSTECVEALLHHHPSPVLNNQVDGVSPLHDALLNGHMDIAKMLLEHAGSVLLRQTNGHGRVPLDLVSEPSQREELLHSAQLGDTKFLRNKATEVNLPLLEAGSSLLSLLIFSYLRETGIPHHTPTSDKHHSLGYRLVRALERHSFQKVTQGWADQRAVRLVEDVETLWELSQGKYQGQVSQGVIECKGENTQFLMRVLEDLRSRGEALVGDL
ncbi:SMC5-SMC6 complex localization factor protein 1 isoform X1 [Astatotilapia calliptera]|uniref:BRCT domain-containing protein n=1 Tax=Astatotilapia calliptera TaxID=8154 RepID=A0AAX7U8Q8_ASTCA|nr:SMC5-SMC6 complex localization factor protein 1 isoform X1 [Astatotilapia calliptera]XP_026044578.1 SMC5-SMC6 complex localization factor protein 1 isoform X1 [Astatotilapia calliptera]XP_026044579.1 SMC5-SMC6 complex localization factor protein 1 isoform X1 [Astatotilapia calliptera]